MKFFVCLVALLLGGCPREAFTGDSVECVQAGGTWVVNLGREAHCEVVKTPRPCSS